MDKKTCLITGATSGLGEALSKKLATKNYNLILISKSKNKLQSLSQLLNKKNIKYISTDLSQIENIKKNINKIGEVDILINNAGNFYFKKEKNKINKTIMLNYFIPFFFIKKFILSKKNKKRKLVINVCSHSIKRVSIPISKINELENYNGWQIYKFSKLLLLLLTNFLSKKNTNIDFYSFFPGRMKTGFGSENNILIKNITKVYLKILGTSPDLIANKIIKIIENKTKKKKTNFERQILNNYGAKIQKELYFKTIKILKKV
jgi:short-subunit dehydrogenase